MPHNRSLTSAAAAFLAGILLLGFAGCNSDEDSDETPPTLTAVVNGAAYTSGDTLFTVPERSFELQLTLADDEDLASYSAMLEGDTWTLPGLKPLAGNPMLDTLTITVPGGTQTGVYTYRVTVTDRAGNQTELAVPLSVTNNQDTQLPTLVVQQPLDSARVTAGDSLQVSALASDNTGIISLYVAFRDLAAQPGNDIVRDTTAIYAPARPAPSLEVTFQIPDTAQPGALYRVFVATTDTENNGTQESRTVVVE